MCKPHRNDSRTQAARSGRRRRRRHRAERRARAGPGRLAAGELDHARPPGRHADAACDARRRLSQAAGADAAGRGGGFHAAANLDGGVQASGHDGGRVPIGGNHVDRNHDGGVEAGDGRGRSGAAQHAEHAGRLAGAAGTSAADRRVDRAGRHRAGDRTGLCARRNSVRDARPESGRPSGSGGCQVPGRRVSHDRAPGSERPSDRGRPHPVDRPPGPGAGRRAELLRRPLRRPAVPAADLRGGRRPLPGAMAGARRDQPDRDRLWPQSRRVERRGDRMDADPAANLAGVRRRRQRDGREGPLQPGRCHLHGSPGAPRRRCLGESAAGDLRLQPRELVRRLRDAASPADRRPAAGAGRLRHRPGGRRVSRRRGRTLRRRRRPGW